MKRIGLIYGLLIGTTIISSAVAGIALTNDDSGSSLEWLGYLVMIVALSVIFIAVKRYRDQELGGVIKFSTALTLGLGIALVAALTYVLGWEFYLFATDYTFMENYTAGIIDADKAAGITGAALEQRIAIMGALVDDYADPLYRLPMTFIEIFPIAFVIALASAAVLRNPKVLPVRA